jgi:hypothetical protein
MVNERAQAIAATQPFVVVTAVRESSRPLSRSFDFQAIVGKRRVTPTEHRESSHDVVVVERVPGGSRAVLVDQYRIGPLGRLGCSSLVAMRVRRSMG